MPLTKGFVPGWPGINLRPLAFILQHLPMQKDLIESLLTDLRPRPGMFLTAYSLSYLEIYLTGVQITCWELDQTGEYSERFFGEEGFLKWSWRKYNLGNPSSRLHHYLDFTNENENEALDLFFRDLDVYNSENSG